MIMNSRCMIRFLFITSFTYDVYSINESPSTTYRTIRRTMAKIDKNNQLIVETNHKHDPSNMYKTTNVASTTPETCGKNAMYNATTNTCECLSGYVGDDPTRKCFDIDECFDDTNNPCSVYDNTRCVNSKGSYQCRCLTGYKGSPLDGISCQPKATVRSEEKPTVMMDNQVSDNSTDIQVSDNSTNTLVSVDSPCNSSDVNLCGDYLNSFCVNAPDSDTGYTCQCDPGYVGNPIHGQECQLKCDNPYGNPCGPDNICHDAENGGYTCEILDNIESCPVTCSPTMHCEKVPSSGYQCVCNPGTYQPNPSFPCRPIGE